MNTDVTCLMVALNASATIARALQSVLSQVERIILVDDGSTDDTAAIAKHIAKSRIKIIRFDQNAGIGAARKAAVEACNSIFAGWLDADDIWLPNRVSKLVSYLQSGADYVFDESELFDNSTGLKLSELTFPDFILDNDSLLYQFGRNYLPTIGVPMARTATLKELSFKAELRQAEDNEHVLNAILRQKVIKLSKGTSYREYCSMHSASRHIEAQNRYLKLSYQGIDPLEVERRLSLSCLNQFEQFEILTMFLVRVENWEKLLMISSEPPKDTQHKSLDMQWYVFFLTAVANFQLGQVEAALAIFSQTQSMQPAPEVLNNMGVCYASMGRHQEAKEMFEQALHAKTNYLDAHKNLAQSTSLQLTTLPLRRHRYRDKYPLAKAGLR